jgi:hypothetical protein
MHKELFKRKLQLVGRVSVEEGRVNFGKLYKEGHLSVNELNIQEEGRFPYKGWKDTVEQHEQKKLNFLKVNWEDDKNERGFCIDSAWSTYRGLTEVTLKWSEEEGYEVHVVVGNGGSMHGVWTSERFNVTFKIEKFAYFNKVWGDAVSRSLTRDAQQIRNRQIAQEEFKKVKAIEDELIGELS